MTAASSAPGPTRIVVGVDPGHPSVATVAWAADMAGDDELHIVCCGPSDRDGEFGRWLDEHLVRPTSVRFIDAPVADTLIEAGAEHDAGLLVIGTHHSLVGAPRVLGSISHRLIRTCPCPVVVVPETTQWVARSPIVAGVGDGPATISAIAWSAWCAEREERPIHLVRSVNIRPIFGIDHAVEVMASYIDTDLLRDWAQAEVDLVASELTERGLTTTTTVKTGRAGRLLVEVSRGARAVVVGKHLDGPVTGYFTGVTLHHVLTHASCPVVVVPAAEPADV